MCTRARMWGTRTIFSVKGAESAQVKVKLSLPENKSWDVPSCTAQHPEETFIYPSDNIKMVILPLMFSPIKNAHGNYCVYARFYVAYSRCYDLAARHCCVVRGCNIPASNGDLITRRLMMSNESLCLM